MFKMTQAIYNVLHSEEDLKVFTEENEKNSCVWLQFGLQNGGSYRINFISTDDDNDVAVRVYELLSVQKDCVDKILPVLNHLNCQYRYVKFVCDEDGDINVEYDFPVRSTAPENCALEIVLRFSRIIKDAYPELMRALWK